ncbi:MAG: hypothetical protein BAA01_03790 [Bacillus thermozeamaize]|mgnify:CR=1 FL=1|uniref:ATP-grasp domain-containing protein n=1 Tax=Bacillus thermozeamaize TaxID=230954 RepID=A0A1Y3PKR3_9BACI|nr:MAG: hypothetical protein BAA01_03790 [Bacillus thermozeamaize]
MTSVSQSKPVKVTVQTKSNPEHSLTGVLSINPKLLNRLKLIPGSTPALVCGKRKTRVRVKTNHHHNQFILIVDAATASHLCLPDGIQLNISYNPRANTLFLGPLFCILVDPIEKPTDGPIKFLSPFIEEVTRYGKKRGTLVFVASPDGVNPEKQQITGWHLLNRTWQASEFPIPDVCYNRISSRTVEQAQATQAALRFLNQTCHLFNTQFLNKWQVHQHLFKSEKLRHYLPETRPYTEADLNEMLKKYNTIYLKPADGSLGRGVIRLVRHSRHITCQYATVSGNVIKKFKNYGQLLQFLKPRTTRQDYLIQEGLKLASWAKRPVDFRILVQKNGTGNWRVTSMVARAARENTVVTNVARGGNIYSVKSILPHLTQHSVEKTQHRLRQLAILIAQELEAQLEGTFAEFGVDIALDIHGNLWLLEVNAKPSKNENSMLGKDSNRPSVRNLLHYVQYATEQQRNARHRFTL